MRRILVISILALFYLASPAHAHTLQVTVVDVRDGKTIIVENTARRFTVVLKGADAPELDQPLGAVARQHLSDLIFGKHVAVEVTSMIPGSDFVARVFSAEMDVSMQMIRDGVAWYDRKDDDTMSPDERRLYAESEQAARNEHRGIWQDPQPVPPWEWRRAKAGQQNSAQNSQPTVIASTASHATPSPARNVTPAPAPARKSPPVSAEEAKWKWPMYTPSGAPFSLRIPGGGKEYAVAVAVPKGQTVNAHFYWTRHLKIDYMAVWASGPTNPQMVSALFDRTLENLNESAAAKGLSCEFTRKTDTNFQGYTGRRYTVQGCYFHGGIRLYYKVEGKTLKIFMVGVMGEDPDDPSINQFLESLVIDEGAKN